MKLIKEIKSKSGEVHFKRWRLLTTPWFDVNIHGIYKADQDKHLHNHPWNIWTMVLCGGYYESYIKDNFGTICNPRILFNIRKSNSKQYHKIDQMIGKKCITLAIMSKRKSDWGYLVNGEHVDHKTYRELKREGKLG